MKLLAKWIALLVAWLLMGVFVLRFLTIHPLQMSLYLALALLSLFAAGAITARAFAGRERLFGSLAGLAFFILGYAVSAQGVLNREDSRHVPELVRDAGSSGSGHTAVVYFTHGEPATYNPIGWINQFREFDEQEITFVPYLARPLFIYMLRNAYLEVGRSDHREVHTQMLRSLEEAYRAEGDLTTRFYLSFLDDEPRPDAAVIQALNDGASRVVVSEVFLTISNHTAEGKDLIREVGAERYGVPVEFTGPLWNSETLMSMFVQRANAAIGDTDKSKVGILLVGHGQPDEWDVEWPTETEQEIQFREDVLDLFAADGYRQENLSLAWMEFKDPKPAEKVEAFYRNGVEKVIYFAAAISADSIHSMYDIPELIEQADVPDDFPLINLGAWNDDPIVIQAIKEKIDPLMAGS